MDSRNTPRNPNIHQKVSKESKISLLVQFDDLQRLLDQLVEDNESPLQLLYLIKELREKLRAAEREKSRFENLYLAEHKENVELQDRLSNARKIHENEVILRLKAEKEKDSFKKQIDIVAELLNANKLKCNATDEDTISQFHSLMQKNLQKRESASNHDVGASRLLLSCSADDLEVTPPGRSVSRGLSEDSYNVSRNRNVAPSAPPLESLESSSHKRKSSGLFNNSEAKVIRMSENDKKGPESIVATTIVTVGEDGGITASSKLTSQASENKKIHEDSFFSSELDYQHKDEEVEELSDSEISDDMESSIISAPNVISNTPSGTLSISPTKLINKKHAYVRKTILKPVLCTYCQHRIRFGNMAFKCRNCRAVCHIECKSKINISCFQRAPQNKIMPTGTLSDFVPFSRPRIPEIVYRTIDEIEKRGINEVGLYRVSGSGREIKEIRNLFKRSKSVLDLSRYEIHAVCGALKDFLKSLNDTVITYAKWSRFVECSAIKDSMRRRDALRETIVSLNDANKDTLAFILLHLQRVAANPVCKMPPSNLASIFAPTLVGCGLSSDYAQISEGLVAAQRVMLCLLEDIDSSFWKMIIDCPEQPVIDQFSSILGPLDIGDTPPPPIISKTPSTIGRNIFKTPSKTLFQSPML